MPTAEKGSKNIYQRLAAAMEEVTYIQKEKKQGMRYSIVSHDDVTAKVRPALLKQGIVYYPQNIKHERDGNLTSIKVRMVFTNIDDPEQWFATETLGYGVDNQDKGPGKAMSYAVKYALLKTLGLETGDDSDLDHETMRVERVEPTRLDGLADFIESIKHAKNLTELTKIGEEFSARQKSMGQMEIDAIKEAATKRKDALMS